MTREEIISMAIEAGLNEICSIDQHKRPTTFLLNVATPQLERFAALVAAAEREECAKVADEVADTCLHPDEIAEAIRARGRK